MEIEIESKTDLLKRELTPEEVGELNQLVIELKGAWPKIRDEITMDKDYKEAGTAIKWLRRVLDENVPHGKHARAVASAMFFRELKPVRTAQEDFETYVLGWCLEILQTAALIADDIMDGSETRRGMPCWYKQEGVGMTAVNDSFLLENLVYEILHKYFQTKDYYPDIVRLLQKTAYRTILGQNLDTRVAIDKNIHNFDETLYSTIVKFKTSYYSYCAPIQAAMLVAGIKDEDLLQQVEDLMLKFGEYFQIQDDYLDCYGDPEVTGKIGTDIIDAKCSWLFVQALKRATDEEAQILMENYGCADASKEAKVKEIYKLLELDRIYGDYELKAYEAIMDGIRELPDSIPKRPFRQILKKLYRREK